MAASSGRLRPQLAVAPGRGGLRPYLAVAVMDSNGRLSPQLAVAVADGSAHLGHSWQWRLAVATSVNTVAHHEGRTVVWQPSSQKKTNRQQPRQRGLQIKTYVRSWQHSKK